MTCALLVGVLLLAVAAWLFAYMIFGTNSSPWPALLSQLAIERRGHFRAPAWGVPATTSFVYGSSWASVSIIENASSQSLPVLEITMACDRAYQRCDVMPRHPSQQSAMLPEGMLEVTLPDRAFHERFRVIAKNEEEASGILSAGVRSRMSTLVDFPAKSWAEVSFARATVVIRKRWLATRQADLSRFVDLTLELYDQLLLSSSEGIEFVTADEAVVIEGAHCVVCGEGLASDIVTCLRCKTPYHRDCWEYAGACSTFGCGETRASAPRVARLVTPPAGEAPSEEARSEQALGDEGNSRDESTGPATRQTS